MKLAWNQACEDTGKMSGQLLGPNGPIQRFDLFKQALQIAVH
jgi:hypothetical protein